MSVTTGAAPKGTGQLKLKKKKAAPKKGRKGKNAKEPVVVTAELLASVPLFRHLDREMLERLAPRAVHVDIERGQTLYDDAPAPDDESSLVFVMLSGDVSVRRAEAGMGEEIVNFLRPGEVFIQALFAHERTVRLKLTAMVPVTALKLRYKDVNRLLKKFPAFRDDVSVAIRGVTERQASRFDNEFQRDIAQFIVDERLTFAGRVKIKRMDICIECDGCYDACRERHGTDRLGPSEVKYGLTEIPQNCHNCEVPECIDKCKFGHISRHPQTNEIVIDHNCTGCTMCARGCSFGSIRMHSLAELDVERYFPDRKPDAKGKNIAQKCDNCTGYEDQACITACPTGALFQVDGGRIFDYWEQFNVHQAPGFAAVAAPVDQSWRAWRRFWVVFTILNVAWLSWECFGRFYWPSITFTGLMHAAGWLDTGVDPLTPLRAGDFLSHTIGYIGGAFLVATQAYRVGKAYAPRYGSVQVWMESHIFCGLLGGIYGTFHTVLDFGGFISIAAFVTMMIAIVTGIVGRYVLYLVPRSRAGQQLALEELESRIQALNQEIEGCFEDPREGYTLMARIAHDVDGAADTGHLLTGFIDLAKADAEERRRIHELGEQMGGAHAEQLMELLREKARLERSVRFHAFLGTLLKRYRIVHVVSSNVMFGALFLHIVVSLAFQVGN
jgi:Fe-S-cluster-containing hydrogenase component 2